MAINADWDAWREYVALEIARFTEWTGGTGYVWRASEDAGGVTVTGAYLARATARGASTDEAAFTGPWHVVRKHVTREFRQWVEEYDFTERLTYSEWVARAREAREQARLADGPEHALGELQTLRRLIADRDFLIREAVQKGASKAEVARAIGLSRQQVHAIMAAFEAEPAWSYVEGEPF